MKVTLKLHSSGMMVCHVSEALTEAEVRTLSQGVAKLLANGKSRILIEVEEQALQGMQGVGGMGAFENSLARERELARKLGGEVRLATIPRSPEAGTDARSESQAAHAAALAEIERLKKEIAILNRQIEGLLARVSEPLTDKELRAAVEHYQALAESKELY